jgi:hypothetical protein
MRKLFLASATAAVLVASGGIALAQSRPPQGALQAQAPASTGAGSYQQSCRNIRMSNGQLSAECADAGGRFRSSAIAYTQCRGDIGNNNGMLSCNGAAATGGNIIASQSAPKRSDNGGVAGAFTGAFLGAGQALTNTFVGNGPPPPPPPPNQGYGPPPPGPPPSYGDSRYGDPNYDWRYAQGGWGYGRRPGEWVPIRDRADWLDRRIEHALRDGRLGRDEARDLRRQLNGIEDMEAGYMRDGRLGLGERADLDRRFDNLAGRFRYESQQ